MLMESVAGSPWCAHPHLLVCVCWENAPTKLAPRGVEVLVPASATVASSSLFSQQLNASFWTRADKLLNSPYSFSLGGAAI